MSRALPAYRKHKNGQAYVRTVRINSGKNYYLGTYGSPASLERYKEVIRQLSVASASPAARIILESPRDKDRTLGAVVARYMEYAERRYTRKEMSKVAGALSPLTQLFGGMDGQDFKALHLVAVQEYMLELGTLCRQEINRRIVLIRRMFRWASKFGEVPEELYFRLKCVDPVPFGRGFEADDVKPVEWSVVQATLPWLSPTVAAMVLTQLLCGMRPQDVCRMRPKDIDQSDPDCWIYQPVRHKLSYCKKKRFIAIPPLVQRVLLPFMDRGPSEWMFSPRESYRQVRRMIAEANRPNRKAKLYPSEVRTRYKKYARYDSAPPSKRPRRHHFITDTYRRSIGYAIKRAASAGVAIPHWHPHQLRHTMSTCISQMFGEQAAQRWLGHERLETTGIYTQRQVKELKDIARRLSSSFSDDSANMITGLVESVTASYDPKKPSAS